MTAELLTCPKCHLQVVPGCDGRCPECGTAVLSGETDPESPAAPTLPARSDSRQSNESAPGDAHQPQPAQQARSSGPTFLQLVIGALIAGALFGAWQTLQQFLREPFPQRAAAFRRELTEEGSNLVRDFDRKPRPDAGLKVRRRFIVLGDQKEAGPGQMFYQKSDFEQMVSYTTDPITIFYVRPEDAQPVSVRGGTATAYRVRFQVYCILWPEKEVLGKRSIPSSPPNDAFPKQLGDTRDIFSWIRMLPREP